MPPTRAVQLRALPPAEPAELTRWSKATSARPDLVQRARARWTRADGATFAAAARVGADASHSAIPALITRFNRRGLAVLR
ncbi:MAG TPA: hypothetical protein VKY74_25375 [Chloroflexia bacterium]|nr:hypothetical protein [Chloroflexia bacterium]